MAGDGTAAVRAAGSCLVAMVMPLLLPGMGKGRPGDPGGPSLPLRNSPPNRTAGGIRHGADSYRPTLPEPRLTMLFRLPLAMATFSTPDWAVLP